MHTVLRDSISLLLTLLFTVTCTAQVRIVNYNTGQPRDGLATVLEAIGEEAYVHGIHRPIDILLVQEQRRIRTDTENIASLLNEIYGTSVYRAGQLEGDETSNGSTGRPGVIYRSDVVELLEEATVGRISFTGQARQALRYNFGLVGYPTDASFYIYNSHYKAGNTFDDKKRRLVEAEAIRTDSDQLGAAEIIYAGDFNIRSSTEAMYRHLRSDGPGQALDPIDSAGTWHNTNRFKQLHTQSPVTRPRYSRQTTGGMDDRLDFQLVTDELMDSEGFDYIVGSYRAFGNNGTHPLNGEITQGSGAAPNVLEALTTATDHLPVVADYQLPANMQVQVTIPEVIAVNQTSDAWRVSVTNNHANPFAGDELDYEISWPDNTISVTDVGGGNTIEHPIDLNFRQPGAHTLELSVTATSPKTANSIFNQSISYTVAFPGDANLDGLFNSSDLVAVFSVGEYEDMIANNSDWADGDWNADHEFDSGDLIAAFQTGAFERDPPMAGFVVPEPTGLSLFVLGLGGVARHLRRRRDGSTKVWSAAS